MVASAHCAAASGAAGAPSGRQFVLMTLAVALVCLSLAAGAGASSVVLDAPNLDGVNSDFDFTATFSQAVTGVSASDFNFAASSGSCSTELRDDSVQHSMDYFTRRPRDTPGWIDPIANGHTKLPNVWGAQNRTASHESTLSLGFSFTWYGQSYTSVTMSLEGWFGFGSNTFGATPSTTFSTPGCAVLWNDWSIQQNETVIPDTGMYAKRDGNTYTMTWYEINHDDFPGMGDTQTFQVTLDKATGITMRYKDVHADGVYNTHSLGKGSTIGCSSTGSGMSLGGNMEAVSSPKVDDTDTIFFPLAASSQVYYLRVFGCSASTATLSAEINAGAVSPSNTKSLEASITWNSGSPTVALHSPLTTVTNGWQSQNRGSSQVHYDHALVTATFSAPVYGVPPTSLVCRKSYWSSKTKDATIYDSYPLYRSPGTKWVFEVDTADCQIKANSDGITPANQASNVFDINKGGTSNEGRCVESYNNNYGTKSVTIAYHDMERKRVPYVEASAGGQVMIGVHYSDLHSRESGSQTSIRFDTTTGSSSTVYIHNNRYKCFLEEDCTCWMAVGVDELAYKSNQQVNTVDGEVTVGWSYYDKGHYDEFWQTQVQPTSTKTVTDVVNFDASEGADLPARAGYEKDWVKLREVLYDTVVTDDVWYTFGYEMHPPTDSLPCDLFDHWGDSWVLRFSMGQFVEYVRPAVAGATVCDVLTSHNKHKVSNRRDGDYILPVYSSDSTVNGGSANHIDAWPHMFWGSPNHPGGCCNSTQNGRRYGWNQAFSVDVSKEDDWTLLGAFSDQDEVTADRFDDESYSLVPCSRFAHYGDRWMMEVRMGGDSGEYGDLYSGKTGKSLCDALADPGQALAGTDELTEFTTFSANGAPSDGSGRSRRSTWLSETGSTGGCCHMSAADKTNVGIHGFTIKFKVWHLLAENSGSDTFTASDFANGIAGKIVACDKYDAWGDVVIRVTMGDYVDYFKPASGSTLCEMLQGLDKHEWANGWQGNFVAPTYAGTGLGGSTDNPGNFERSGDTRSVLPAWAGASAGGYGHLTSGDSAAGGRAYKIHVRPVTPIETGNTHRNIEQERPAFLRAPVVNVIDFHTAEVTVVPDEPGYTFCKVVSAGDYPPLGQEIIKPSDDPFGGTGGRLYAVEAGREITMLIEELEENKRYDLYCLPSKVCKFCERYGSHYVYGCREDVHAHMVRFQMLMEVPANVAPVITVNGGTSTSWDLVTGPYVDQGATAVDPRTGRSLPVTSTSTDLVPLVGSQTVTYSVAAPYLGTGASATRTVTVTASNDCHPTIGTTRTDAGSCDRIQCVPVGDRIDLLTITADCTYTGIPRYGDSCKLTCRGNRKSAELDFMICGSEGKWQWAKYTPATSDSLRTSLIGEPYAQNYHPLFEQLVFRDNNNVWPRPHSYHPMDRCYGNCFIDNVEYEHLEVHPSSPCLVCHSKYNYAEWTQASAVCQHGGGNCALSGCPDTPCPIDTSGSQTNVPYSGASATPWGDLVDSSSTTSRIYAQPITGPTQCSVLANRAWPDY